MENLEIFARLKDGTIICIERCDIKKKIFFGFTFKPKFLKTKRYKSDDMDDAWQTVSYEEKIKLLKKLYKSSDHYGCESPVTKRRHEILTDLIIVRPHLASMHSKVV